MQTAEYQHLEQIKNCETWQNIIDVFAENGIDESTVLICIKKAVENFFMQKYKTDIIARIDNGTVIINKYFVSRNKELKEKEIKLSDLNQNAIGYIKKRISDYINLERQRFKYIKLKQFEKTVIRGTIVQIEQNMIKVRIQNSFIGNVLCCYPLCGQPKHERKKYQKNDTYDFFVKHVFIKKSGRYNTEVVLSRTSKGMIEFELKSQGYNVKCIRRFVGKLSVIKSKRYIPKNIIRNIESKLREKIFIIKDKQ